MNYQIKVGDTNYEFEVVNHQPEIKIVYQGKTLQFDLQRLDQNLYSLILEGKQHLLWLEPKKNGDYQVISNHEISNVVVEDERQRLREAFRAARKTISGVVQVKAPMPGLVTQIEIKNGQPVKSGQGILIIEAMKMENEIKSPVTGTVTKINVQKGEAIEKDALLVEIDESGNAS